MTTASVEGAGGLSLAVRLAGPEGAPAILFLHGWSQHSLAWTKQLAGPLAERFRLAALDLRGHGASDKPEDPGAYQSGALWAGDVAAAIAGLGLRRPVVVGWSMGGWVLADYLRAGGARDLAGAVFVGASARTGGIAPRGLAATGDQGEEICAAIDFAKAMTAAPLSKRDLATVAAWQMLTPPHVRAACRARAEDWRATLGGLALPALAIQGAADRVCPKPVYEELLAAVPGAEGVVYPGAGHMPFWEEAARFDADLAEFVERAGRTAPATAV